MPGGRLTHEDRREIATGLAAGLGYAEIARHLDRPTSTVSREIARNGGAHGYRADHAHYATTSRARRRRTEATEPMSGLDQQVRDFVERFARMMVDGGLPRMASRVLALLYTTDSRSLTAAELVRELRVSPASVSNAVGYLEQVGMVYREPDPRRRRQHYVIAEDVWLKAWQISARTNLSWAETAAEGATLLGPDTPAGHRPRLDARPQRGCARQRHEVRRIHRPGRSPPADAGHLHRDPESRSSHQGPTGQTQLGPGYGCIPAGYSLPWATNQPAESTISAAVMSKAFRLSPSPAARLAT